MKRRRCVSCRRQWTAWIPICLCGAPLSAPLVSDEPSGIVAARVSSDMEAVFGEVEMEIEA